MAQTVEMWYGLLISNVATGQLHRNIDHENIWESRGEAKGTKYTLEYNRNVTKASSTKALKVSFGLNMCEVTSPGLVLIGYSHCLMI